MPAVEFAPAIAAGLVAGQLMEGPVYLQKALGLPIKQNIFRTWGLLLGRQGTSGYLTGFFVHELVAALAALGYAVFFAVLGVEAHLWQWGIVAGLVHYAVASVVVSTLPSLDPDTGRIGDQGVSYVRYGPQEVATFLIGHLGFGLLVGALYGLLHSTGGTGLAF